MKGKVTSKKLVEWLNEKFKEYEINEYIVTEVVSTRFSSEQIQGGACRLYIRFNLKDVSKRNVLLNPTFYCYYSMKELQWYINNGYELSLKLKGSYLTNLELDLKKI